MRNHNTAHKEVNMPGRPWGSVEEQQLVEMILDGSTPRECAQVLGRSPLACATRAYLCGARTGKRGRPVNSDRELAVIHHIEMGRTISDIAREFGVASSVVWKVVRRLRRKGILLRSGGKCQQCRYKVARWWRVSATMSGNGQKKWENILARQLVESNAHE